MVMPRITDDEYPAPAAASPELSVPPRRRKFTAKEKLRILGEIDRAAGIPGAIGAIMQRDYKRLEKRLERAEAVIDIQKKLALLLGHPIEDDGKS